MDEWLRACKALRDAGVRFLVVGGFGAELHFLHSANQIATQDMDLLLPANEAEVLRGLLALSNAGFKLRGGDEDVLPDEVVAAGIVRQAATLHALRRGERVDLMTWARGLDFEELWTRHRQFQVRNQPVPVAPLEAILRSKQEAFRLKDRLFLERFKESITEALERERRQGGPPSTS